MGCEHFCPKLAAHCSQPNALGIGAASFASVLGQWDLGTGNGEWEREFGSGEKCSEQRYSGKPDA